MKTPFALALTGGTLALLCLFFGRDFDVAACAVILFGTGLVAWTIEQYEQHRPH